MKVPSLLGTQPGRVLSHSKSTKIWASPRYILKHRCSGHGKERAKKVEKQSSGKRLKFSHVVSFFSVPCMFVANKSVALGPACNWRKYQHYSCYCLLLELRLTNISHESAVLHLAVLGEHLPQLICRVRENGGEKYSLQVLLDTPRSARSQWDNSFCSNVTTCSEVVSKGQLTNDIMSSLSCPS